MRMAWWSCVKTARAGEARATIWNRAYQNWVVSCQLREALRGTVRRYSPFYLAQGVLMVVLGVVALTYPLITTVALVVTLGWLLILHGLLQAIGVIGAKDVPYFWLELVSAVLAGVVGLLLLSQPVEGVLVLSLLLIVFLASSGMARVVFALTIRPLPQWGWLLLSGIMGIMLAFVLWSMLPEVAGWLVGVLLRVHFIAEGAALVAFSLVLRRST
jgi:uncharacterized membrane protein HdeD (DUF308 family)